MKTFILFGHRRGKSCRMGRAGSSVSAHICVIQEFCDKAEVVDIRGDKT